MPEVDVMTLYETGNIKFFAAKLNADGTFGEKSFHEGLMEINIDFSQDITEIGSDDDPAFITLFSPLTGEGTVKFAVLPYNIYDKFFNVTTDKNGAVVISSSGSPKHVAFGFYSNVGDGSESMFTIYKAAFKTPPLSTVSFDGQTIRDLSLSVKVYPFSYTDSESKAQKVTYSIVNSKLSEDSWASVQEDIYVPDQEIESGV